MGREAWDKTEGCLIYHIKVEIQVGISCLVALGVDGCGGMEEKVTQVRISRI